MENNWRQGGLRMAAKIGRRTPMVSGHRPTAACVADQGNFL